MQAAVAGFINEGHTCGASAALALLLSSPRVLDIVLKQPGTKGSVLEALHKIAVDAWQFGVGGGREDHVVSTTRTLRALVGPPRDRQRFVGGRMVNALEFTQAVLEGVPQLRKLCEIDATTVTKCECGFETLRSEAETSLLLPATSASTPLDFAAQLEASLYRSRPAVVRAARCGGCCEEGRRASGRFEVTAAGEVLVLSVVSDGADVVPSPLDPPPSIQVGGHSYSLRSVVVHHDMPFLHFTARSVALDGTFRAHDDAFVTVADGVGGRLPVAKGAYMCLYELEETSWGTLSRVTTRLRLLHDHLAASASPARGSGQHTGRPFHGTVRSTCTLRPHPPRAKKREMQRRERKRRCYRHKADYSPALSNHYLTHPRATALHSPSPSARRRLLFQGRPDGRAERQTAAPAGGRTTVGCRRTGSRGRRDRRERFVFRICRARGRCANGRRRKLRRWRGGRRCIGRCIPVSPYLPESSNVWPLASWV